jgi:peptidoglycan-associated lipoprotein
MIRQYIFAKTCRILGSNFGLDYNFRPNFSFEQAIFGSNGSCQSSITQKEENMSRKLWIVFAMVFIIPGLLMTASCAKKMVKAEPAVQEVKQDTTQPAQAMEVKTQEDDADARRKAEEERLRQEALRRFTNEDIYFDYDKAVIKSEAERVLADKAEYMKMNSDIKVVVEGHCDERGSNEYNLALGERRAKAAKAFLKDLGIDVERMSTISYGEERPVDDGHNEEAWAKNRRAHFVVE